MAALTLRTVKGTPLTNSELDANFTSLNTELGQKLVASSNLSDLANAATARTNLGLGNVENKSSATIRGELTSSNVTTALGFTPYNATNPSGFISGITSSMVTTALGYTPYNSTNPSGYITSSGSITGSAYRISFLDTRGTDDQPQGKTGYALSADFKNNTAVGSPPVTASGTYSHIITVAGWDTSGGSGGWPSQLSIGDGIAVRQATSATAWGAWKNVLHSGNYSNYALPLSGGTLSGAIRAPQITAGGSTNTDVQFGVQGTAHLAGDTYLGGTVGNVNSWSAKLSSSAGTTTLSGSRFVVDRFGYGSQPLIDAQLSLITLGQPTRIEGGIRQGNNLARPLAEWSAGGTSTGMVYIEMPGTTGNYGMIHAVVDVYEYNGNAAATIIVGGHNWSSSWYNVSCNVIGQTDKQVRLAVRGGKFVICIGDASSTWTYGTVMLRKIHNASFYNNVMDMGAQFVIAQTTSEGLSGSTGDLRALRTPASFSAGGAITQGGNQVLHAGNYTSYSPSLTGSGASGTWGISITGNANSASTLNSGAVVHGTAYFRKDQTAGDYTTASLWTESYGNTTTGIAFHISGVLGRYLEMRTNGTLYWASDPILHAGNYSSYAAIGTGFTNGGDLNTFTTSGMYRINNTEANRPGDWGQLLVIHGGSDTITQLYGQYNGSMYYRSGNPTNVGGSGSYSAWKTLLDSSNYSSYALPLSGGTLSGQYLDFSNSTPSLRVTSGPGTFFIGDDDVVNLASGAAVATPSSRVTSGVAFLSTFAYGVSQGDNRTHFGYNTGSNYVNYIRGAATYFDSGTLQAGGNQVLHAGNYSSYALPLSGGTVTGNLYVNSEIRLNAANTARIAWRPAGSGTLALGLPFALNPATGAINIEASDGDTGGLMIDNEGVTVYGAGDTGYVFRVIDEDQYQTNGNSVANATQFWVGQDSGASGFRNQLTIAGNTALHAGNYTSYSPSLTGSGASGTWGISVTGSAGSVAWTNVTSRPTAVSSFTNDSGYITSSGSISGSAGSVSGLTLTSSANGINPDNVTQNQLGYNNSVSLFGQSDGGLYSSAYSSSWIHQIYGDFRTGQIAIRGKNSGTWQSWRTVLDSSNYSSYALPLSGGTLTGRVTFPSATANQPQMPNGYLGLDSGDGNFDIWGISRDYYPSHATAANAWGIRWDGDSNQVRFIGGGSVRLAIDLDGGANGALTWEGNSVLHAGNYTSYSPAYSYFDDYTRGNYRVIADYSGGNTWYIRSNGRFTWARVHDWSQSFDLDLGSGTTNANNGWAVFGQQTSNSTAGTWRGTRFVQYTGSASIDGDVRAARYFLGNDSNYLLNAGDGSLRVQTGNGYIDIGPKNSSWCHIYSDRDFYTNRGIWINGSRVLDAGNYTSYSPSLTGSGASGTWGINISGNAAESTRASGQSGYPHVGYGMYAFYNWGGSNGGASAPSDSTYTVGLSVGSHPSDQAYGFQIARNMWNTGLWTRGYDSGWGSWVRLLDSSNFSSYAAPASHSHNYIPINPDGDGNAWTYSDENPTINGVSVGGGQRFGADGSSYEGFLQAKILNAYNGFVNSANGYYVGNFDFGANSNTYSTTKVIDGSGNFIGGKFIALYGNPADTINGAPWYGLGGAGNLFGPGDTVHLAGYYGLRLRTASAYLDLYQGSAYYSSTFNAATLQNNGNQVLHAGNYTSYGGIVRALGYPSSGNDWNALGNDYPNSVIRVDPSNFSSTSNGPTAASYTYGTLLNLSSQSSSQAQIYISHAGNDLIFRGGWNGDSWQTWNKVLTNVNYSSYAVPQSDVSVSGGGNVVLKTQSNGYLYINNWIHVAGAGLFSGTNSAHFLPNDGTYGAWKVLGTRNGWNGIEFGSLNNGPVSLMINPDSNTSGFYNNSYGWQMRWNNGVGYVHKGAYGGGTEATILDSANYSSYALPLSGGSLTGTLNSVQSGYAAFMYGNGNTGSVSGIGLNVYSTGGNGAIMAFHRGGYYAVNMGLDSDNVLRIGGWSASANRWQLDMSGNGTYAGNVTAYSDERLKKDWADLPDNFIERLAGVKHGTYTRIDTGERQAGASAQDWQALLPEVVTTTGNDDTLALAYGNAALVSAIELAKRVVRKDAEIADLKARVEKLESLIATLIGD